MATPTGTDPFAPVPPGWPSDDPTVRDDVGALGHRRPRRAVEARPEYGPGHARLAPGPDMPVDDVVDDRVRHDHDHGGVDDHLDHLDDADDADEDDLIAGTQPAGRVLVIMVAALVLAMLVNADALVERAARKPPGAERDRSLAIWHPVQDVSHALQLYRIRQVADWALGDDGPDGAEVAPPPSGRDARRPPGSARERAGTTEDDTPSAVEPATATLRTPTAEAPLRLWVGGDSMAQVFGQSLVAAAEATGVVDPTLHYEMASGLTRPDYYDWPRALAADVDEADPEVVVVVFGVNDAQGIVLADGSPIQQVADPAWAVEYRRRVGTVMDQLRAEDRMIVWVGQPPMREPDYGARLAIVNEAFRAEAAARPWVTYVDPAGVLGDQAGAYTEVLPDTAGAPADVRQDDGIHLTTPGGDLLAAHVLAAVEAQVDLSGGAT